MQIPVARVRSANRKLEERNSQQMQRSLLRVGVGVAPRSTPPRVLPAPAAAATVVVTSRVCDAQPHRIVSPRERSGAGAQRWLLPPRRVELALHPRSVGSLSEAAPK